MYLYYIFVSPHYVVNQLFRFRFISTPSKCKSKFFLLPQNRIVWLKEHILHTFLDYYAKLKLSINMLPVNYTSQSIVRFAIRR